MSRRGSTVLLAALLAIVLLGVGLSLPVPYVSLQPGPTTDTLGKVGNAPLIEIVGRRTYPTTGHLNLTTVAVGEPQSLLQAMKDWWSQSVAIVPREIVYPPDKSDKEVEQQNEEEMVESQEHATTAALHELNIPVTTVVSVGALGDGSPAAGKLAVDDVLTSVDGTTVTSAQQLRDAISKHQPGQPVTIGYSRAGKPATASIVTTKAPDATGRAIIGVTPKETQKYPFTVNIRLEDVGGPSAGLMFALGIIERLTPEDITGGKFIAGTGTIDDSGQVGPIGGIQQKIIAARAAGATVFMTPAANCAEAKIRTP